MKDLLRVADLAASDLRFLVELGKRFKSDPVRRGDELLHQTAVLYFNKPSTRTRISMCTAVARLGGVPLTVGPNELQLGRGETIEDTAQVVSRYAKLFVIRTFADEDVRRFAAAASIPVVNALTDGHHPCQALADVMTLEEHCGPIEHLKVAYVGDGNNVCHSLMEAVVMLGGTVAVATPEGYAPDPEVVATTRALAAESGGRLELGADPRAAVADAHAVYTDTWVSMGDPEEEHARRVEVFAPFQVNASLMRGARPDARMMHCLPDHRGEEVTADVVDGPQSVVFDQAENRLHTAVGLFHALLTGRLEGR
ncbi:MAG: ornithine carbamoyltransferase [Alphaproteobacteria bacterium]|nr:ornithine carbamoyltransferase [Alphaproteobacteria bacterium]